MQGMLNKYPPDGDYEAFNCSRLAVTSLPTENWMLRERNSATCEARVSVPETVIGVWIKYCYGNRPGPISTDPILYADMVWSLNKPADNN